MINAIDAKAYWIPEEYREDILSLPEKLAGVTVLGSNDVYAVWMFDIYNTFISKHKPEDIKCSKCRSHMINRFSRFAQTYRTYGITYPER